MSIESNAGGLRHRGMVGLLLVVSTIFMRRGFCICGQSFQMSGRGWTGRRWPRRDGIAGRPSIILCRELVSSGLVESAVAMPVRPEYLADDRVLAGIHAYDSSWSIAPKMAWMALRDGLWMSPVLFPLAVVVCVLSVVWLRELWRVPLFGAAVIAMVGCLGYIGYHASFEPRYYVVMAMPMMMVIGLSYTAGEGLRLRKTARWAGIVLTGVVVVAAVGMAAHTVEYVVHPEYSFWEAAEGIAAIMQADGGARPMLLSDSGDDITLWTGVPAVALSYTTHGTDAMLSRYQPGWYAAWLGHEDMGAERVRERYRLNEVAHYQVFDDETRQTLVLYKLTPR